jgi:hypothetical protein
MTTLPLGKKQQTQKGAGRRNPNAPSMKSKEKDETDK